MWLFVDADVFVKILPKSKQREISPGFAEGWPTEQPQGSQTQCILTDVTELCRTRKQECRCATSVMLALVLWSRFFNHILRCSQSAELADREVLQPLLRPVCLETLVWVVKDVACIKYQLPQSVTVMGKNLLAARVERGARRILNRASV